MMLDLGAMGHGPIDGAAGMTNNKIALDLERIDGKARS
jgi:hypothetical protein